MQNNFYITTSIAYVNGTPHLGFALESIMADAINRYQAQQERDSYFLTGTDEHGIKIFKTAAEKGVTPKELCDANAEKFEELKNLLTLSNDDFIRTSDSEKHWPSAQALWKQLVEQDDIYKKEYEGLYCEGCETFLPEKDLVDGNCSIHHKPPVKVAEENYFFRLSKYSDGILEKIKSKELEIIPEFRQNEIVAMLENGGLNDVSFSRPATTLPWGIPVPGDEDQNMYVWCDALTNYISALNYVSFRHPGLDSGSEKETKIPDQVRNDHLFEKYWNNGEVVHVIGKDIVRFHAGIWIGMLMSAGLKTPEKICIHGFLTSEGEKMSKSLGNVVDPFVEVEQYGVDALRYFLLSQVPVGQDYDFTRERFEDIYNAHLANNLGNLVNRVAVLSAKNEITPDMRSSNDNVFKTELEKTWKQVHADMKQFELHRACETIWKLLDFLNKQMDEHKPWIMAKESPEQLKEIMPLFLESIRQVSYLLEPFIPTTAQNIQKILGVSEAKSLDAKQTWNAQSDWSTLGEKGILFPRLEK